MKQASFIISYSLIKEKEKDKDKDKEKDKLSKPSIDVQKKINKNIEKQIDSTNIKSSSKPRKLVENVYYFN